MKTTRFSKSSIIVPAVLLLIVGFAAWVAISANQKDATTRTFSYNIENVQPTGFKKQAQKELAIVQETRSVIDQMNQIVKHEGGEDHLERFVPLHNRLAKASRDIGINVPNIESGEEIDINYNLMWVPLREYLEKYGWAMNVMGPIGTPDKQGNIQSTVNVYIGRIVSNGHMVTKETISGNQVTADVILIADVDQVYRNTGMNFSAFTEDKKISVFLEPYVETAASMRDLVKGETLEAVQWRNLSASTLDDQVFMTKVLKEMVETTLQHELQHVRDRKLSLAIARAEHMSNPDRMTVHAYLEARGAMAALVNGKTKYWSLQHIYRWAESQEPIMQGAGAIILEALPEDQINGDETKLVSLTKDGLADTDLLYNGLLRETITTATPPFRTYDKVQGTE